MRLPSSSLLLILALACADKDGVIGTGGSDTATATNPGTATTGTDGDGDGHGTMMDCDDTDPDVHPDAAEVCDGIDNDCDGVIDGSSAQDAETWYTDGDGDGFGDPDSAVTVCDQPSGAVQESSDCDDSDASINPDGEEICNSEDDDCNGEIDDNPTDAVLTYFDADADGWGVSDKTAKACPGAGSWAEVDGDCDDNDGTANPGADETCDDGVDNDCDEGVDEGCSYEGWQIFSGLTGTPVETACTLVWTTSGTPYSSPCGDCDFAFEVEFTYDRGAQSVDPGGCVDGMGGDASLDGSYPFGFVPDYFGSGYGAVMWLNPYSLYGATWEFLAEADFDSVTSTLVYEENGGGSYYGLPYYGWEMYGYALTNGDVPALPELDFDGDGYPSSSDCDDSNIDVNPGAAEVCDGVDNNCDGLTDDDDPALTGGTVSTFSQDWDGDGYGDSSAKLTITACEAPSGYGPAEDCDDREATTYPGAVEICSDGADNDCDGVTDTDCDAWVGERSVVFDGVPCEYVWQTTGVTSSVSCPTCDLVYDVSATDNVEVSGEWYCGGNQPDESYTLGYVADYYGVEALMWHDGVSFYPRFEAALIGGTLSYVTYGSQGFYGYYIDYTWSGTATVSY